MRTKPLSGKVKTMTYLKSIGIGILIALCGAILSIVALAVFVRLRFHTDAISFHISLLLSPTVLIGLLILFLAGFFLEFHKLHGAH